MPKIKPLKNNNSIQIKFQLQGVTYRFTPIPGALYEEPEDYKDVEKICEDIRIDIKRGAFDQTLDKYRIIPKTDKKIKFSYLENLYTFWLKKLDTPESTKARKHKWVLRKIQKSKIKLGVYETDWLVKDYSISPGTFNNYMMNVRTCFKWAIDNGYVDQNPWRNIKLRTVPKEVIEPFTPEERIKILQGFKTYKPHYLDFVSFLMLTGCRLSEAIGFKWDKVDFQNNEIIISQTLSIDPLGNGYERVQKGTKKNSIIYMDMSDELREILLRRSQNKEHEEYVFRTVRGFQMSCGSFRQDNWKYVLKRVGLPYKRPHFTRHTFASEAIQQGSSPVEVAYLLGHRDSTMVNKTYTHIINRPKPPTIKLK